MSNTPTNNHNYQKPAEGDADWDTTLNNNYDALDLDITVVDTAANITTANYTPDGQIAVAQDTGEVFYGDGAGSSWDSIGTIGSGGSGGSAPKGPQRAIYDDGGTIYALDEDGSVLTSNADPTVVLQSVLDTIKADDRGEIHILSDLSGIGALDATNIAGRIKISGRGQTTLSFSVTAGTDAIDMREVENATIRGLKFVSSNGNGNGIACGTNGGMANQDAQGWRLEQVEFENWECGLLADPTMDWGIYDSSLYDCRFFQCDVGMTMDNSMNAVVRGKFRLCGTAVEQYADTNVWSGFYHSVFSGCNYCIDNVNTGLATIMYGCWFEQTGEASLGMGNGTVIRLLNNSHEMKMTLFNGCYFSQYERFDFEAEWTDPPKPIAFRDCWFMNWTDWTNFPYEMLMTENCWRYVPADGTTERLIHDFYPYDVTSRPAHGWAIEWNDGTVGTAGPAMYNPGTDTWTSLVDGATIS